MISNGKCARFGFGLNIYKMKILAHSTQLILLYSSGVVRSCSFNDGMLHVLCRKGKRMYGQWACFAEKYCSAENWSSVKNALNY